MPSMSEWYLAAQNAPKFYWMATAGAIAHPATRKAGLSMASFGIRASANMAIGSTRALLGTTLRAGGTATLGSAAATYAGALTAGYVLGATVGTGVSYAVWGDDGASHALDFYTGQGDHSGYFDITGNFNDILDHYL